MSDIFLSYASEDRERVRPLAEALTQEGWSVFWDRGIPVGKTWHEMLEEELEAARSLVIVWSKNSIKSKWVREEADAGIDLRLPLFPVLLDVIKPPLGFRGIQAADFSTWDGTTESAVFQTLVRDIMRTLGPLAAPEHKHLKPEPIEIKSPPSPKPAPTAKIEAAAEQVIYNSLGMKLVLIPAGTYMMGSGMSPEEVIERYGTEGVSDLNLYGEILKKEHPQHQVTISRPFYLQTTPVTQGQWQQVMGANPSHFKKWLGGAKEDHPVEQVSWEDVQYFIAKLNRMDNTDNYRLPTEAEWEYACRAGSTTTWYFGDDEAKLAEYAWYDLNSQQTTHPVAQLKPNAWGLYDMHGNVLEWCQDWYGEYPAGSVTDPTGPPTGVYRVLRGGSWNHFAWRSRSAYRFGYHPVNRHYFIGCRVARAL